MQGERTVIWVRIQFTAYGSMLLVKVKLKHISWWRGRDAPHGRGKLLIIHKEHRFSSVGEWGRATAPHSPELRAVLSSSSPAERVNSAVLHSTSP